MWGNFKRLALVNFLYLLNFLKRSLTKKMKIEDAIKQRRSVRNFTTKEVPWKELTKVLEAAFHAPMAGNVFSVRCIVTKDVKKKRAIAKACLEQRFLEEASHLIIVCSDLEQVKPLYGDYAEIYGSQQAGAAIENMLLQAVELGLAACWVGSFDEGSIKALLKITKDMKVEAVIALGYEKGKTKVPPKQTMRRYFFFEEFGFPHGGRDMWQTDFWGTKGDRFEK